ncbi:MAG: O-antigen ligase family protein [bacterium]|nr:O-antigen ligase family protein [bacterium]
MLLLGIITAALVAYISFRKPSYGLGMVACLLPAYGIRFAFGPLPSTVLEMVVAGFIVGGVARAVRDRRWAWPPRPFLILGLAWIAVAGLSLFWTPDLRGGLGMWKAYFVEPVLVVLVAWGVIRDRKELTRAIWVGLGFAAVYVAAIGMAQSFFDGFGVAPPYWNLVPRRITSVFEQPNMVSLFLTPLIAALGVPALRASRKTVRLAALVVFALGWYTLTLTHSAGGLLGLVFGMAFVGSVYRKTRWWTIGLVMFGASVAFGFATIRTQVVPVVTLQDWSGNVRLIQWREAWDFIKDHPLRGAGLAGYQEAIAPYHKAGYIEIFPYPHNVFLNVWVELGVVGLVVFLALLGMVSWFLVRGRHHPAAIPLAAAWIALVVHGMVDIPYFKNDLSILFWFLVLFSLSLDKKKNPLMEASL